MTPRLRVGDRAICVTGDVWNGSEVTVFRVLPYGYWAQGGGFDSVEFFRDDELVPAPAPPRTPSPVAAWFRVNLPWLLAALGVGGIAALVIAVLGSEGAL